MAPLFNQPWFNAVVKPAFGIRHHYNSSTVPLLYVLSKTLIRHTKQQVIVGEEVLKLPKKTEEVVAGGWVSYCRLCWWRSCFVSHCSAAVINQLHKKTSLHAPVVLAAAKSAPCPA